MFNFFQHLPLHACILLLLALPLIGWLVGYGMNEAARGRRRKREAAERVVAWRYSEGDRVRYEIVKEEAA